MTCDERQSFHTMLLCTPIISYYAMLAALPRHCAATYHGHVTAFTPLRLRLLIDDAFYAIMMRHNISMPAFILFSAAAYACFSLAVCRRCFAAIIFRRHVDCCCHFYVYTLIYFLSLYFDLLSLHFLAAILAAAAATIAPP